VIALALLELYASTFTPTVAPAASPSPTLDAIALPGSIAVPPTIEDGATILVVQPLLGMAVQTRVEKSRAQLPSFIFDRRVGHAGVVVITNATKPAIFITPSTIEVGAIRAALPDVPATAPLEIGAVDLDGDRRADLASTYPGQRLLVREGNVWSLVK